MDGPAVADPETTQVHGMGQGGFRGFLDGILNGKVEIQLLHPLPKGLGSFDGRESFDIELHTVHLTIMTLIYTQRNFQAGIILTNITFGGRLISNPRFGE
jgi:hypothetical protein